MIVKESQAITASTTVVTLHEIVLEINTQVFVVSFHVNKLVRVSVRITCQSKTDLALVGIWFWCAWYEGVSYCDARSRYWRGLFFLWPIFHEKIHCLGQRADQQFQLSHAFF